MDLPQHSDRPPYGSVDPERLFHILDDAVYLERKKHFSTLQITILRGVWAEQNYQDIAQSARCSETHVKKVGSELWEMLSTILGEPISKKTLRAVLERHSDELLNRTAPGAPSAMSLLDTEERFFEFPNGPVKLNSRFYISHPVIETRCHQAIQQPGGLLRISAPSQMGKTSLLNRILYRASQLGYLCVAIDLQLADRPTLQDLDRFLQWFCTNVAHSLQLPIPLCHEWNAALGSKISCRDYFKNVLLPQLEQPLVLAIDKLDVLLAYPDVASDFFSLLRAWYEQGKESELWQKLRLILVYSTKSSISLSVHQSPFNVGLAVELPELTVAQVATLSECYGLTVTQEQLEQLMILVGGHPHLIQLALYHMAQHSMAIDQLIDMELTETNPFQSHLQQHLTTLKQNPSFVPVLRSVLKNEPVHANTPEVIQLYRVGLVQLQQGEVKLRCELYRRWLNDCQLLQSCPTPLDLLPSL